MKSPDRTALSKRWDEEYRTGRYTNEPPVTFVKKILQTLQQHSRVLHGRGVYVGCGNGRNYIPLIRAGLNLYGLDVSPVAIAKLASRLSKEPKKLICADFRTFHAKTLFDYLIAIQVFQHGSQTDVASYFKRVDELLIPGGLFFLRVNSSSTQIYFRHTVIERNYLGGLTVQYHEGPKKDLAVHFFSIDELLELTKKRFIPLEEPYEETISRSPPKTGYWAQWELILKRK